MHMAAPTWVSSVKSERDAQKGMFSAYDLSLVMRRQWFPWPFVYGRPSDGSGMHVCYENGSTGLDHDYVI
jgi:hypothetical protein